MDSRTANYLAHYKLQDGGGLNVYSGQRFQRGGSWFGRLIGGVGSFFKSILPSIGKAALPSAVGLAEDIISGENVGQSTLNRLKEAGRSAANETLDQLKNRLQKGTGIGPMRMNYKRKYTILKRKRKKSRKRRNKRKKLF